MMFPIKDNDMVVFMPIYGNAIVVPIPTTISSSAESTEIGGAAPCLEGDEEDVESQGCVYIAPPYVIPGVGTLKISSLGDDQTTSDTKVEDKKVIIQGSLFQAVFEVQSPAMMPVTFTTDPLSEHSGGVGMFVPTHFQAMLQ